LKRFQLDAISPECIFSGGGTGILFKLDLADAEAIIDNVFLNALSENAETKAKASQTGQSICLNHQMNA
jgi:hypothetical protein